ncbi:hypothetical protein OS242_04365 [Tumebacillus sp. DT12]|uniref:Uncharacterized protein n=1 Tax=Tumebacillus lacus TaxID=2995335 RepID=A0ABT3WX15_9BACL|nr:hypothetical protein [Tumebacillus lacus]MCX7569184.1 hypothetical protein [Tumebacillus lacus]
MAHRITGLTFLFIAAMLYCGRYITAALLSDNPSTHEWFAQTLKDIIGGGYTTWNVLALLVGIGYLIYAEMANHEQKATKESAQDTTQDTESL